MQFSELHLRSSYNLELYVFYNIFKEHAYASNIAFNYKFDLVIRVLPFVRMDCSSQDPKRKVTLQCVQDIACVYLYNYDCIYTSDVYQRHLLYI